MASAIRQLYFWLLAMFWSVLDVFTKKDSSVWAFSTHPIRVGEFTESPLAVFDHIKSDEKIRKLIFYRGVLQDNHLEDARNCEFVKHGTLRGLLLLSRCKVVFISNSIAMEFSLRWGNDRFRVLRISPKNRVIVNLSHGVSIKRLMYTSNKAMQRQHDRVRYRQSERKDYTGLIATSDSDGYVMASMYYPLNHQQIWLTGSPRNDFLLKDEACLPAYIRHSVVQVRDVLEGRRLVLYAPTYRQTGVSATAYYYQFDEGEIERLRNVLRENGAVLGYRPHYFKNSMDCFNMGDHVDGDCILDLSQSIIPDISALIRECELVVTDYSSVYTEALYLGKPGLCFAYDLVEYNQNQDGLLYDPNLIFCNRVYKDFDSLLIGLESCLKHPVCIDQLSLTRRLFFKFDDDRNAERVCAKVKQQLALM